MTFVAPVLSLCPSLIIQFNSSSAFTWSNDELLRPCIKPQLHVSQLGSPVSFWWDEEPRFYLFSWTFDPLLSLGPVLLWSILVDSRYQIGLELYGGQSVAWSLLVSVNLLLQDAASLGESDICLGILNILPQNLKPGINSGIIGLLGLGLPCMRSVRSAIRPLFTICLLDTVHTGTMHWSNLLIYLLVIPTIARMSEVPKRSLCRACRAPLFHCPFV